MDNICILNHIIERELTRKGGKVYLCFADIKPAFDKMNREVLWKIMERKGVSRGLTERIKEIYADTRSVIRVEEEMTKEFWTEQRVR